MMVFLLTVNVLALAAWLFLIAGRGGFWRADQVLNAPAAGLAEEWPAVVAVIPARNEADVIAQSIAAHMALDYPGPYRVIVVDDRSEDGTAERARQAAEGGRHSLTVTTAPPLEAGWTGKLWALRHGLDVAQAEAPGAAYVLLTDADICYERDVLTRLVTKAETDDLALTSLMARLDDRGPWAGLLIPAFIFFFQKLYPFAWVNDSARKTAGAAGGCMLVRRSALAAAGGLETVRGALIDDCALARRLKTTVAGSRLWLGLTRDVISLRDNRSLSSIWNMVVRTAYTQLGYSPVLLAGCVLGMIFLYLTAPLTVLSWPWHHDATLAVLGGFTWVVMAVAYEPTLALYNRPKWQAFALPLAAVFYAAMTLGSAVRHWRGGAQWKGRRYQAPA